MEVSDRICASCRASWPDSPSWGAERGELAGIEVVELQEADAGAVRAHDHIAHPAAGVVEHRRHHAGQHWPIGLLELAGETRRRDDLAGRLEAGRSLLRRDLSRQRSPACTLSNPRI